MTQNTTVEHPSKIETFFCFQMFVESFSLMLSTSSENTARNESFQASIVFSSANAFVGMFFEQICVFPSCRRAEARGRQAWSFCNDITEAVGGNVTNQIDFPSESPVLASPSSSAHSNRLGENESRFIGWLQFETSHHRHDDGLRTRRCKDFQVPSESSLITEDEKSWLSSRQYW